MDNLISTVFPNPTQLSPKTMNAPPVSSAPTGNPLNHQTNHGIAPPHYRDADGYSACNTLPPSPKDHITNDPACVDCKKYPLTPFKRNKCYMLYSPQQNMWGPVCGDGGSNGNWVRGNRFGVNYEFNNIFKRPDYGIDVPKYKKSNPVLVSYSPFYPFPDYYNRFDKDYKSYPYENKYIRGRPYINYPYTTLSKGDNVTVSPYEKTAENTYEAESSPSGPANLSSNIVEGFDVKNKDIYMTLISVTIVIIIILMLCRILFMK